MKKQKFSVTEMLSEIYQGFSDQHDREFIRITVRHYLKKHKILPNDKEVNEWVDENIDKKCSASSGIYKFRQYLKRRIQN
jgi:hypothetical protein